MFEYMYHHKWIDAPSIGLLTKYDTPKVEETLPRPIPPEIKIQLDDYLESTIIPLLEEGVSTPILKPVYWDLLIVIRYGIIAEGTQEAIPLNLCIADASHHTTYLIGESITQVQQNMAFALRKGESFCRGTQGGSDLTADAVLLQRWLLGVPDTKLNDWRSADLCSDGKLDVFDLCFMKKKLLSGQE